MLVLDDGLLAGTEISSNFPPRQARRGMNLMMRKCPTDAKLQTRRFSCESLDEGKPRDDQSDGNGGAATATVAQAERAGSRTTRRVAMRHSDLRRLNERHFCGGAFFRGQNVATAPSLAISEGDRRRQRQRPRPTGERDRYVGSQLARRSTALAPVDSFSSAARSPQLRSRSPDTAAAATATVNVAHSRLIEQREITHDSDHPMAAANKNACRGTDGRTRTPEGNMTCGLTRGGDRSTEAEFFVRPTSERASAERSNVSQSVSRLELGAVYHHVGKSVRPRPRPEKRGPNERTENGSSGRPRSLPPLPPPPRAACKLSLFCGGVLRSPSFLPSFLRRFAFCS